MWACATCSRKFVPLEIKTPLDGKLTVLRDTIYAFAHDLKTGHMEAVPRDRKDLLDSLADQIVTAVGVGHCAKMNVPEAVERVDASNWTKYVDGQPVFDDNGKVKKGPNYQKPDLTGLYEEVK